MELINVITFGPICLLGLLLSQVLDTYSSGIKPSEFDVKKWLDENLLQLTASLLCIFVVLLVGDGLLEAAMGTKLTIQGAFWLGLGGDSLTNYFARRRRNIKEQENEQ